MSKTIVSQKSGIATPPLDKKREGFLRLDDSKEKNRDETSDFYSNTSPLGGTKGKEEKINLPPILENIQPKDGHMLEDL